MLTFVLSALAAASAVYWGLKGPGTATPTVAAVVRAPEVAVDPLLLARALGAGAAPAAGVAAGAVADTAVASSRFVLMGVVADTTRSGAALISVDGKPARPVRVGGQVEGALVLQSVSGRRAVLAPDLQAPAAVVLELAPLPR